MAEFSDQARSLAATAAEIAKLKGADLEAKVLGRAKARLVQTGYDNWNGGIDIYCLLLEVPVAMYAAVEDQREQIEKSIHHRVRQLTRADAGNSISEVVVSPILVDQTRSPISTSDDLPYSEEEAGSSPAPSFWEPGHFRLR